jgi:protein TonB
METADLSLSSFKEIVFENRFRQYGAYMLRKTYSDRLLTAALVATGSILLLIAIPFVMRMFGSDPGPNEWVTPPTIIERNIEIVRPKDIDKPKKLATPPPAPKPPVQGVGRIASGDDHKPSQVVLINDSLTAGDPNSKNKKDTSDVIIVKTDPTPDPGEDPGKIFTVAEVNPECTCDIKKHLASHLNYPLMAKEAGIQGTVYVSFVVDQQGDVTDVKVLKDIGGGCGNAAVNAVKSLCKFTPGRMGGKPVKVMFNLPVRFTLQ